MDREKVIKGLECCSFKTANTCKECPYGNVYGSAECAQMAKDALTLLKEQEAKIGYWINPASQDCHCSECGEQPVHETGESVPLYDFCPYCGAKMEEKWK